tara:strand:+ start:11003 stop:11341 length:339 start_codon:yes stop_codon:yes gene_type:complete
LVLQNRKIKRLKGKTKFRKVFNASNVIKSDFLILRLIKNEEIQHLEVAVAVSKKNFKRAVDRNRVKRLLREAIKKNEKNIAFSGRCILFYKGLQLPDLSILVEEVRSLIKKV